MTRWMDVAFRSFLPLLPDGWNERKQPGPCETSESDHEPTAHQPTCTLQKWGNPYRWSKVSNTKNVCFCSFWKTQKYEMDVLLTDSILII